MLAVQLTTWGAEPVLRDIPVPRPRGEELLLQVTAAGLCRSDLHVMDAPAGSFDYPLPLTLGHEVAGTVVEVGPDADSALLDEAVVVHGVWGCGSCRNCARGRENYCLRLRPRPDGRLAPIGNGLGHHGGLAQAMIVPSWRFVVPAGGVNPVACAPLADAGLTAYHAVREHLDLIDEGAICLVIGIGGLGHLAIQVLRDLGVGRIVAVDPRSDALDMARRLGADTALANLGSARSTMEDGADLVFDFVGSPETTASAAAALAPGGRLAVVGSAGGRLEVGKNVGLAAGWRVTAPFWGPRSDLMAVVDLARRGALHMTAATYPLTDAIEVYRRLRAGAITGRAVLVPPLLTG
ncbi:NAD(P)-dependent alcohol dehydrogenase [Nocardia sp. NBC_00881]|uniref:NAD(P)-dependent alcohol dehydrogenase n=1 Tax=Nocardia sp. NBC_00881 TaxID=2975995 RepID=UPI00386F8206|nr:NAD(P)-dependent alcohol dehydrogenase [Nocardia sp. NBC_00881]